MNDRNHQHLWREILADDASLGAFRQASLDAGLAALARRRQRRRHLRTAALVAPALLLGFALVARYQSAASAPPLSSAADRTEAAPAEITTISDDELFALFPGRSLALVGRPGEQQLVFLDLPPGSVASNPP